MDTVNKNCAMRGSSEPGQRFLPGDRPSVLLAGIYVTALFLIGRMAAKLLSKITLPIPINYGEGPILDQVRKIAELRSPYPPLGDNLPYNICLLYTSPSPRDS